MSNPIAVGAAGISCGFIALIAEVGAPPTSFTDLAQVGGTGGLIFCLMYALRYMARGRDAAENKVQDVLGGMVQQNMRAFVDFKNAQDLGNKQNKEMVRLLQEILYEFRDGMRHTEDEHGHDKTH